MFLAQIGRFSTSVKNSITSSAGRFMIMVVSTLKRIAPGISAYLTTLMITLKRRIEHEGRNSVNSIISATSNLASPWNRAPTSGVCDRCIWPIGCPSPSAKNHVEVGMQVCDVMESLPFKTRLPVVSLQFVHSEGLGLLPAESPTNPGEWV